MVVTAKRAAPKFQKRRFEMQYLLALYSDESAWDKMTPEQQQQGGAAYMAYTQALSAAGVLRGSNRLRPSTTATTLRTTDGKTQVLDGPYVDSKEQLGGYYLIEVPDLDAALSWAGKCPGVGHGIVEVRAIWAMGPANNEQNTAEPATSAAR
jgi:hypothetical protein